MKKNYIPAASVAFLLLLFSCSSIQKTSRSASKTVDLDTLVVKSSGHTLPIYQAAAPRTWDIYFTKLALRFNFDNRSAEATAEIYFHPLINLTGEETKLFLDAKSMKVSQVELRKGKNFESVPFVHANDSLEIDMGQLVGQSLNLLSMSTGKKTEKKWGIAEEDSFVLKIKYVSYPYGQATTTGKAILEDRGLYFVNARGNNPSMPRQIWTQGETESNSNWFPTIDQPNERMRFEMAMTVPDTMVTLSNGLKKSSVKLNDGLKTDTWYTPYEIETYAAMMAISNYAVVSDTPWKDVNIDYYVDPEYKDLAPKIFEHTSEMIDYFSNITGVDYPWKKYSQVIGHAYVSGAMENTSASLFGSFVQKDERQLMDSDNQDIVAHELFHQWFGNLVTAESWANITLNESFSTYGEILWHTYKNGEERADEEAQKDLNSYIFQAQYNDQPLARYHYKVRDEVFDRVSYSKGGLILRYLNSIIGDEAFGKAMNIYLTKNAHQSAEIDNWRLAVEEASGRDMHWFFNQWYFDKGYPKLEFKKIKTNGGMVQWHLQQTSATDRIFILPFQYALLDQGKISLHQYVLKQKTDTLKITQSIDDGVIFIPDFGRKIVGLVNMKYTREEAATIFTNIRKFYWRNQCLYQVLNPDLNDALAHSILQTALNDVNPTIRNSALNHLLNGQATDGTKALVVAKLKELINTDSDSDVRTTALKLAYHWRIDGWSELVKNALDNASYKMSGAAMNIYRQTDSAAAFAVAVKNLNTHDELLKQSLQTISKQDKEAVPELFEKYKQAYEGKDQLNFYQSFFQFWLNTRSQRNAASLSKTLKSFYFVEELTSVRNQILDSMNSHLVKPILKDREKYKSKIELLKTTLSQLKFQENDDKLGKTLDKMISGL